MIIECVNCNKKFNINPDLIPQEGREIQCGSCNHRWHYKPDKSLDESLLISDEKIKQSETPVKIKNEISKDLYETKTTVSTQNSEIHNKTIINKKAKNTKISNFFSYLIVFIISCIALIILLDTLKLALINIFPGLEVILFNFFETLKDIKLFIIDLT